MNNIIYLHRNKINGKVYIGYTSYGDNPNKRWRNGEGYNKQYFYKAIQKYGWDNFEHIILEDHIPKDKIDEQEEYWIQYYDATNPEKGYNMESGGAVFKHHSEITKQKMSDAYTEERRQEYSNRAKNFWANCSKERKEQQSQIMVEVNKKIDRSGANNSMYGSHRTGADAPNKKAVICVETGQIFPTTAEASKWINGTTSQKSHISAVCKGTRNFAGKHPISGIKLHWKYYDIEKGEIINNED